MCGVTAAYGLTSEEKYNSGIIVGYQMDEKNPEDGHVVLSTNFSAIWGISFDTFETKQDLANFLFTRSEKNDTEFLKKVFEALGLEKGEKVKIGFNEKRKAISIKE